MPHASRKNHAPARRAGGRSGELTSGPLVSLPVLPHPPDVLARRVARIRRWRLRALVFVHLLILAHVAHWLISGTTLGRFVLSDSMETLELGRVNPGFILFALAAACTAIGGRWLCGWACHMGALQDACAWLLRRVGLRPRVLRLRLLGYMPVALAFYMFVWPTFNRELLSPLLSKITPDSHRSAPAPFPGFESALTSDNLWQGMPSLPVAIPFLLICGGASIYFLGNRGFCRYGCPYGGVFTTLERLAPFRITVDLDLCDGCGKCTAACTSGIRVHEEVRAFGRVVSPACSKTLDCKAACPHDALSLSLSRPAIGSALRRSPAPARPPFDASLGLELALLAVFVAVFFITRGLYALVPMLMAVGISICACGITWFAWRLIRDSNLRLASLQLKRGGAITSAGLGFLALTFFTGLFLAHSALVRGLQWRASVLDARVLVSAEAAFSPTPVPLPDDSLAAAKDALALYQLGSSLRHGGLALLDTHPVLVRTAWLKLVLGDNDGAESALRRAMAIQPTDPLSVDLARLFLKRGQPERAQEWLINILNDRGDFEQSRALLATLLVWQNRADDALTLYQDYLATHPQDAANRAAFGALLVSLGRIDEGRAHLTQVIKTNPRLPRPRHDLAASYALVGDVDTAVKLLEQAARDVPAESRNFLAHADLLRAPHPHD
ncbi:MAG: 4Fe-4S binding protein [Leptolyngbya sp. PLA3]|nr:MAG: 4Fe-4S binding protein [Cyanobacteria bacterium CYA]MCE7968416.1 4Fe-4S binding protein [Leptolyngbya sp. PL-A3]